MNVSMVSNLAGEREFTLRVHTFMSEQCSDGWWCTSSVAGVVSIIICIRFGVLSWVGFGLCNRVVVFWLGICSRCGVVGDGGGSFCLSSRLRPVRLRVVVNVFGRLSCMTGDICAVNVCGGGGRGDLVMLLL